MVQCLQCRVAQCRRAQHENLVSTPVCMHDVNVKQCVAARCRVLQDVAGRCSVLLQTSAASNFDKRILVSNPVGMCA